MKNLVLVLVAVSAFVFVGCTKKNVNVNVVLPTGDVADEVIQPTETDSGDVANNVSGAVNVSIDTGASVVNWHGERIVGNAHDGTVTIKEGFALIKDDAVVGGEATIDMTTIIGDNEMTVKHLKNADFFDVETYPTSMIKIKEVTTNDSGAMVATADLTIKNITKEVEFPITMNNDGSMTMDITIDRTLWDIKYDSGKFFSEIGDKAIRDEITFKVMLKLAK